MIITVMVVMITKVIKIINNDSFNSNCDDINIGIN